MKFSRKDLLFSVITGFTTGVIAWRILIFLGKPELWGVSTTWLLIIIPILWIIGVNLGYFLGRWMPFFNQFGKFTAIGFTNFSVYAGVLNLLIAFTGITAGIWYSVFAAIAFTMGSVHSYIWNKYWVFESGVSGGGTSELGKFVSVAVVAGLLNVSTASFVVNIINPLFGISPEGWANVGGIIGSAAALIFSFIGFKFLVFKK